jgi:hypothetical protein
MSTGPQDGNSTFSGLGKLTPYVAAGVFFCMTIYCFWQVPRQQAAAMAHGEAMMKAIVDQHKAETEQANKELVSLFNRLLDQQKASVAVQRANGEIQKQLLSTAQGNTMELVDPDGKAKK